MSASDTGLAEAEARPTGELAKYITEAFAANKKKEYRFYVKGARKGDVHDAFKKKTQEILDGIEPKKYIILDDHETGEFVIKTRKQACRELRGKK